MVTKYKASDKAFVIDMFDDAIKICKYERIDDVEPSSNDILRRLCVKDENDDEDIVEILLLTVDDDFVISVITAFYAYSFLLIDVNSTLIAYLIRNATRVVDGYDESADFFTDFFMTTNLSENMLNECIQHGIDEHMMLTKIFAVNHNKKAASA